MNSVPNQPEPGSMERALRLPAHCTTVTAEDLHVRLVLASDLDSEIAVDASEVESVGQAVLQLLVAARVEAGRNGQAFVIKNPSAAFVERVQSCRLAHEVGLTSNNGDIA